MYFNVLITGLLNRDNSAESAKSLLTTPPQGGRQRCRGEKPDGTACKAQALPGSEFCFFLDPDRREEVVEAARKGGSRRTVELPEGDLLTPEKARRILSGVISGTLAGRIPDSTARTVGYLLQIEAKVREGHDLENRVEALEELRQRQKGVTSS